MGKINLAFLRSVQTRSTSGLQTYEMGPWQWEWMASISLGGATSLQR